MRSAARRQKHDSDFLRLEDASAYPQEECAQSPDTQRQDCPLRIFIEHQMKNDQWAPQQQAAATSDFLRLEDASAYPQEECAQSPDTQRQDCPLRIFIEHQMKNDQWAPQQQAAATSRSNKLLNVVVQITIGRGFASLFAAKRAAEIKKFFLIG